MLSPNSPQHAAPEAGFPKSILKKKQGEVSANFSPMQSCKIPSPPARGFSQEQERPLISAQPRLVSQQSQLGWLEERCGFPEF